MAKALKINAFAIAGRIRYVGYFYQGDALNYVLLPLRDVLI